MPDLDEFPWLARLLQVNDSAFPTGGYAHSYGFEQVVCIGLVRDEKTLDSHLENHVWPMLIHFELPALRFAQAAAQADDIADLIALDAEVDASKSPREIREASRATGRRRLHAFREAGASPIIVKFARAIGNGAAHGNHCVVFGAGLAPLPTNALLTSWAFQSLSAICLAAPKLLRLGQDAAQRALSRSLSDLETRIDESLAITRKDFGWFDPLTDIASMQHEIAHERLFIS